MNIKEALTYATTQLKKNAISSPELEARILLTHAINKPQEYLLAHYGAQLSQSHLEIFKNLCNRRLNSEPISYIIGVKEFYGREFIVNNKVLIPRNDTETLVDAALAEIIRITAPRIDDTNIEILELGTGSGCIAVTLALELSSVVRRHIVAIDISSAAILVAWQNALKYDVIDQIELINSDWFESLDELRKFDFIISNPPYISRGDTAYVADETIKYEPHLALFAANNGLSAYQIIARDAKKLLKTHGKLIIEIGFNQATTVSKIFADHNYKIVSVKQDLAGLDRVLILSSTSE